MRKFSVFGAMLMVGLAIATAAGADVVLVQDGQSRAAIHVAPGVMAPDDKGKPWLKYPASEVESQRERLRDSVKDLALYLHKISGATVEIVEGAPAAGDARVPILIGDLARAVFGEVGKTYPFKQAYRMVADRRGVGFLGESDLATSYAIYELLDRLGCRWYMPSVMGECIPSMRTIAMHDIDLKLAPGTIYRTISYGDDDYKRRNRMGGLLLNCGQLLEYDAPSGYLTKEDKTQHPEWLATTADGKPMPDRFKWSNKELAETVGQRIIERLDKDPQPSMTLSPEDGATFDESPQDRAIDADDWEMTLQTTSLTDRLMVFCNRVAAKVATKYPNELLGVLAYVQFTRPPVREKVHPNVIPQIAPITYSHSHPMNDDTIPGNKELRQIVERWGKLATMTSYYAFGYHLAEVSAPDPMIARWSNDVPFILANNCKLWQPETTTNFESSMQAIYLGNRLAFNPALKPVDIVRELNEKFYGHAAPQMAAYWQYFDDAWVKTTVNVGCGWGYLKRFPPPMMSHARELLNAGAAAAQTPEEKFRVGLANDSLTLFELFMKMRHDQAEGRFANLSVDSDTWRHQVIALGDKYQDQFCFGKVVWEKRTYNGSLFDAFYKATYDDAARIARDCQIIVPGTLRQWRYRFEKEPKNGEAAGFATAAFDDRAWPTTDVTLDSWADLGHTYELGSMWYRTTVEMPAPVPGKKVYLWISATDGSAKVFVNGHHVPYVTTTAQPDKTTKTESRDAAEGYAQPFSFDITSAIQPGANQITILGTKPNMVNELGTGGLLGPVAVYGEK